MKETRIRSLTKTLTWRVTATLITLGIAYQFTGSLENATKIALIAALIAMIGYYIHERMWNKIDWGRS